MPSLLYRYATPLITALFLVSLVSGVALFLHLGSNWFHAMHEWLSLALILPFGLHLWRNWRPMTAYLRRPPMAIASAATLVAALAFALPAALPGAAGGREGPPQFALADRLLDHSVAEVAPAVGLDADALAAQLTDAGFTAVAPGMALRDIASASGKSATQLVALLAASGR